MPKGYLSIQTGQFKKGMNDAVKTTKDSGNQMSKKMSQFGQTTNKVGGAVSALGGTVGGTIGKIGTAIKGLVAASGPVGIILTIITLIIEGVKMVASYMDNQAEKATKAAEQVTDNLKRQIQMQNKLIEKADEHAKKLEQLAKKQSLNNSEMQAAKQYIKALTSVYGNLGIQIDQTTGKITGFARAQKQMQLSKIDKKQSQDRDMRSSLQEQAKAILNQAMGLDNSYWDVWGSKLALSLASLSPKTDIERDKLKNYMANGDYASAISRYQKEMANSGNDDSVQKWEKLIAKLRELQSLQQSIDEAPEKRRIAQAQGNMRIQAEREAKEKANKEREAKLNADKTSLGEKQKKFDTKKELDSIIAMVDSEGQRTIQSYQKQAEYWHKKGNEQAQILGEAKVAYDSLSKYEKDSEKGLKYLSQMQAAKEAGYSAWQNKHSAKQNAEKAKKSQAAAQQREKTSQTDLVKQQDDFKKQQQLDTITYNGGKKRDEASYKAQAQWWQQKQNDFMTEKGVIEKEISALKSKGVLTNEERQQIQDKEKKKLEIEKKIYQAGLKARAANKGANDSIVKAQGEDLQEKLEALKKTQPEKLQVQTNDLTKRGGMIGGAYMEDPNNYQKKISDYSKQMVDILNKIEKNKQGMII